MFYRWTLKVSDGWSLLCFFLSSSTSCSLHKTVGEHLFTLTFPLFLLFQLWLPHHYSLSCDLYLSHPLYLKANLLRTAISSFPPHHSPFVSSSPQITLCPSPDLSVFPPVCLPAFSHFSSLTSPPIILFALNNTAALPLCLPLMDSYFLLSDPFLLCTSY